MWYLHLSTYLPTYNIKINMNIMAHSQMVIVSFVHLFVLTQGARKPPLSSFIHSSISRRSYRCAMLLTRLAVDSLELGKGFWE